MSKKVPMRKIRAATKHVCPLKIFDWYDAGLFLVLRHRDDSFSKSVRYGRCVVLIAVPKKKEQRSTG